MKWFVRYYLGQVPTKIKKNITVEADTIEMAIEEAKNKLIGNHAMPQGYNEPIKIFDAVRITDENLSKNDCK